MLRDVVPYGTDYWAGQAGDSPFAPGERLIPGTRLARPTLAWFYPEVPPEQPIPFEYTVLYEDSELIVVDKPHFLPTTSNGRIVRETLQTRLRVDYGEEGIVPLHRLDRLTAGVVVCSRNPATRGKYQRLFQDRGLRKHYRARVAEPFFFEGTVELAMYKPRGSRQVLVCEKGTPTQATSTETYVCAHGREVELQPRTGHTHQLRVVLNHLGHPILGDDTYPADRGLDLYDFSRPLQLVHERIEFTDPLSGEPRAFSLAWP
ncbi:pseudouridine synthase [Corynebacterium sp.]|uniref:pseudouridine synthase n=1 Tax=Corynebacterium sp. TaxID=1720 RepID=UPI0026DBD3F1|nr:pseudouridine synthase [Corynebacterium sp.]MDO5032033.1 pseudouridine synthase [Corynebacterium sp.]